MDRESTAMPKKWIGLLIVLHNQVVQQVPRQYYGINMRKYLTAGLIFFIIASMGKSTCDENIDLDTKLESDNVKLFEDPVIVEFPLRGEWMAPTTPGKKVPSHGTDQLGERFAFDFLQVDWERNGRPFYNTSLLRYVLFGVSLDECYCWGKEIYAPCDGKIIIAEDGYTERPIVHWVSDLFVALKNAYVFDAEKDGIQPVAGNYIVMKCNNTNNVYAAFAHLQKGSITVSVGQSVQKGDLLGKVGHSGNSTAPHLHFQLMDSSNLLSARGIPCAFEQYDLFQDGKWKTVYKAIPSDTDRIRFNP